MGSRQEKRREFSLTAGILRYILWNNTLKIQYFIDILRGTGERE